MGIYKILIITATGGILASCASNPDPIIDQQGVDQKKFVQDWVECEAYSKEIDTVKGIAKGAATGVIVGGVAGAIGGDKRKNAAYGGLYGATRSGLDADRDKQMIFKRCMRGRGYRVLN
jgi:outer membrane lipoprotein SlyB